MHLLSNPGGTWSFDFPTYPAHADYFIDPGVNLAGHRSLSMTFILTLNTPPFVHLYFQRNGDDPRGAPGMTEYYRWWSRDDIDFRSSGKFALTVPLTTGSWVNDRSRQQR
jgi:hypothetical protein